jgi:hypothetical protein
VLKVASLTWIVRLRVCWLYFVGVFSALSFSTADAQYEIDLFNLTDVSGDLSVRYILDERQDGESTDLTSAKSSRLLEELSIRTKSYIYHPAFLNIIASGGPLFTQQRNNSVSSQDALFGYDVALNFLSRKPYPFRIFFSQAHPNVSTGLSGSYLTERERFGIGGDLLKPLTPIQISWNATRDQSRGEGLGASTDSSSDRAAVSASLPYLKDQNVQLGLSWFETLSRSGSPGLPIAESTSVGTLLKLTANNRWGSRRQFVLRHNLLRDQNTTTSAEVREVESTRYTAKLNWDTLSSLRPSASLRFFDQDRGSTWRRALSANLGSAYRFQNQVGLSGSVNVGSNKSPDFSQDSRALRLSAAYATNLPIGRLGVSAGASIGRRDQTSLSETLQIFDELVTLIGSTPVALQEQFVLENTIIVMNVDRTQTFAENIDYRLVTIGSETTIERIINGNILDGQDVFIDYEIRTGGTVEYQNVTQSLTATLAWSKRASLFFSIRNHATDVLSGEATTPLNDSISFEIGGRVDYPLPKGWLIGGDIRTVKNDEQIDSFVKSSLRSYLQSASYWNTQLRFGLNRELVDYESSRDGVDSTGYTVSVNSVIFHQLAVKYTAYLTEDDGGARYRENNRHSLRLDWRYRLVTFSLVARTYDSVQGEITRKDTDINMIVRRYF